MQYSKLLNTIDNIGYRSNRRTFPGFSKPDQRLHHLEPRGALKLDLEPGDLVRIDWLGGAAKLGLLAFRGSGQNAMSALGIDHSKPLNFTDFESGALTGWLVSNGANPGHAIRAANLFANAEAVVLSSIEPVTVWITNPVSADALIELGAGGSVQVEHVPSRPDRFHLPEPLGHVTEEFTVSRGTAHAYEVPKGHLVQIIDVEGQQCSDFQALRQDALDAGLERAIDGTATRSMVRRAYPTPGLFAKFFDLDLRPMMELVQDTCGRHDTFGLACTARGYEERGYPGHLNCSDNISNALDRYGVPRKPAWPAINFFWNTWIDDHHGLATEESHSRPGDYVVLKALEDLVCVSTACPDDLDPINGWNPTDVHVRIYAPEAPIQRAVAYRKKEDAPMQVSTPSAFHERTSALTSNFAPARDLWVPDHFPATGVLGEYWACREKATLQDMSGLRKFDIIGPDAERLLQRALTRDVSRLAVWRGSYALMCDETGAVIDDGTLFRLSPTLFRWCCGSEESARVLETLASDEGLQVRVEHLGGSLPNLALQGPQSRDVLRKILFTQPTVPSIDQMKWFGVTVARLHHRDGPAFMLSRTGYTGELGYEIFCAKSDALAIWDAVMAAGEGYGVVPMGNAALEIIRIEAGLAAAGAEFAPGVTAHEAGLGFAITKGKTGFVGEAALARSADNPAKVLRGLAFAGDEAPRHGTHVFHGERPVGVVTSATMSPTLGHAIAMARLAVEFSETGTALEVGQLDGHMKRLPTTVTDVPFVDPTRTRARA
ncbi:MAG: DUF1989 domain-containing protein [Pseudomonadota bacterium]